MRSENPQHPVFFHSGYSLSEKQSYAVLPDRFRFCHIILYWQREMAKLSEFVGKVG